MKKILLSTFLVLFILATVTAQNKQTFKEIGVEFESSLLLKKISDNPASPYAPRVITYDGISANGKPYFSVTLAVEEYVKTKPESSIVELMKIMLPQPVKTEKKNGLTFYIASQKSNMGNDDTYYLNFVKGNRRYSFTIDGKTGTKAEMEKIMNSFALVKG